MFYAISRHENERFVSDVITLNYTRVGSVGHLNASEFIHIRSSIYRRSLT